MRNADYIPVAQLPVVDLGARYEAAKARREEAELRKLEYLNQFQQTRGRISPGLLPEVSKYWEAIEKSLDSGDMSFEAKKNRAELYRQYQNVAADAISFNQELNEREATILSDPSKFNDPYGLVQSIEQLRSKPISPDGIVAEINALPSLGKSLRSKAKTITPGDISTGLLTNLKQGGGITNLYDPATGILDKDKVFNTVKGYMSFNELSPEEEDAAIANSYRKKGWANASDYEVASKLQKLTDEERVAALEDVAAEAANALINSLASDITSEQEKNAAELGLYGKKLQMQAKYDKSPTDAAQPSIKLFTGDVEVVRPKVTTGRDGKQTVPKETEKVNAGLVVNSPLTGEKPSFIDPSSNVKYTVQSTGVSRDGLPQLIVTYPVSVGLPPRTEIASRTYPVSERVLASLSNKKQAETIAVALNNMMSVYSQMDQPPPVAPGEVQQTMQQFNQPLPFQVEARRAEQDNLRNKYLKGQ
jgi:hypothetical protein